MVDEIAAVRSLIGEMRLYPDGVIVHRLDLGARVDVKVAVDVERVTAELAAGRRVAVVVDMREIAFADRDSRDVFAEETAGGVEVATALVVSPVISEFLATHWVGRSAPTRPTAIFYDLEEAIAWAGEQLASEA